MVMTRGAPLLALALAACGPNAEQRECRAFAAATNISDYVDASTGRILRDESGNVLDPNTGRVALTRWQVDCIVDEDRRVLERFRNGD